MVGGHSELARDERLFRFVFPERPGRADALPVVDAPGLEHQPVPLPQPGRGLRPHPGRHPGAAGRRARPSSPSWKPWPTPMWRSRPTRCTGCSCAEAHGNSSSTLERMAVSRSLIAPTSNPLLERALLEKLSRRAEAAGSLGELEPLAVRLGLMQNTLKPRFRDPQLVVFAADHGMAVDGIDAAGQAPDLRAGAAGAQRPAAAGGVRAHPADRADRRRLRRGRGHRRARAAADAQDRPRHAQCAHHRAR